MLLACNDDINDYSIYIKSDSISSGLIFYPKEEYAQENSIPKLFILFETKETFPCINFNIQTTTFKRNNELIIRFEKITGTNICLTAIGPASTLIEIPGNITSIVLINGKSVDRYLINQTKEMVELTLDKQSFSKPAYYKLYRYPENSFAYVCGTYLDNKYIYNDFLKILKDSLTLTELKFKNNGQIQYPLGSSGHYSDFDAIYFYYTNRADYDKAGELLRNYTLKNKETFNGVGIYLVNWENKYFRSWMFY